MHDAKPVRMSDASALGAVQFRGYSGKRDSSPDPRSEDEILGGSPWPIGSL
jgi:hypothetical protein